MTRASPDELTEPQSDREIAPQDRFSPVVAPPTRSSFMASWLPVNGAAGYRLDVSNSPRFEMYLSGYHDLDVGHAGGRVVSGLGQGTTYYYRVRAYGPSGTSGNSTVMSATTAAGGAGLIINPTFDSSITSKPNAAAIEAAINRAISIYESLFTDRVTISILFRYSTTGPDGGALTNRISQSDFVVYTIGWDSYVAALRADAQSSADATANANLPGSPLSTNVLVASANGRALGLDTPPAMTANGSIATGAPYDGIVTVNSSDPFQFTRPPSADNFDAQRSIEHEIDEVIGFGSHAGRGGDLRPQDLFSWASPGSRNLSASGTRYFSIDGGRTRIVNFNQDSSGDLGDWQSASCPQPTPYVQNAFGCRGQTSDVTATSPEGINLDVIGYNLASVGRGIAADMNGDGKPDLVLYNSATRQTAVWYLNNNVRISSALGPTIAAGWSLVDAADFDGDGHPDYVLFNSGTGQTAIWYLSGTTFLRGVFGPTVPAGWQLVRTGDFNRDGKPDYLLYNPSTHQTALWYLNNAVRIGAVYGQTLPSGWNVAGLADFNGDGKIDYLLFDSNSLPSAIWYLSGATRIGAQYGPNIASGYQLVGTADFNRDGHPDYLLYNSVNGQTAMWYLNNNVLVSGAYGPVVPAGWSPGSP